MGAWLARVSVVAPDQRGIGLGSKPEGVAAWRIDHLAADIVALVRVTALLLEFLPR